MFPGIDGQEPISFRAPIDPSTKAEIRGAFDARISLGVIIDEFGLKATSAALSDPNVAEAADPDPLRGVADAA